MKIKADFNLFFHVVLTFPFILAIITATGREPFFITAPFFIIFMGFMGILIIGRKESLLSNWGLTQTILLSILVIVSIYNFSSLRYSLPIVFTVYLFVSHVFLSHYASANNYSDFKYFKQYFIFYIILSIFFILVPLGPIQKFSRFDGFLGSPTVYSAFLVLLYILALPQLKSISSKIILYLVVFTFVLLSKTRLVLILMIVLPFLYLIIEKFKLGLKKIFLATLLTMIFLYPAYKVVIEYFPELVTIRYKKGEDRSYDLRFYLYSLTQEDFLKQDFSSQILGQGNEHSRLLVKLKLNEDIYPHNDFIRVINDWGILGAIIFFIVIFRYGTRSKIALMIAIIYLIQFYSNLIFNLFLVSILMGVSILSKQDLLPKSSNDVV
jgi:hypothetical protein